MKQTLNRESNLEEIPSEGSLEKFSIDTYDRDFDKTKHLQDIEEDEDDFSHHEDVDLEKVDMFSSPSKSHKKANPFDMQKIREAQAKVENEITVKEGLHGFIHAQMMHFHYGFDFLRG